MLNSKYNGYSVHLVESVEEISVIKKLCNPKIHVGIDTETDGLSYYDHNIAGVCISCGTGYDKDHYHGFYLPVRHIGYNKNLPIDSVVALVQWLIDNFVTIWWNRDFDAMMLEKEGVIFPCPGKTNDAQCMAHLVRGDSFPALKDFAHDYCKLDVLHFSDNNAENNNFKTTDPTVTYIYCSQDPLVTVLVARKLWADYPYIHKIYPIDNKFAECMRRIMYSTDLYLDHNRVNKLTEENARELAIVKNQIFQMAGYQFKLDSNVDKADCLSRFVTLTAKTSSGKYRVDKEVLQGIDHPMAKLLLHYANLTKFRSTYLLKMQQFPQPFHVNYQHCNVSCLTKNNKVRTKEGIKSIADVVVGDQILSENGFFPVTAKYEFVDDVVRVQLRNGAFIEGNRKHPVLTADGNWTKLGDLIVGPLGTRVTMCRTMHKSQGKQTVLPEISWGSAQKRWDFSRVVDIDMARIIGFLDGDGSLVSDGVKLCFSTFEPEVEEFYINLFATRLNMKIPIRYVGKDHTIQYKFCSTALSKWFRSIGVKPYGIEDGVDVSTWSSECQLAYVAALFDTDGLVNAQRNSTDKFNLCISMKSKGVIDNIAIILRFHGIDVHTTYEEARQQWRLRVRTFTKYGLFKDQIACYMVCQHKVARLSALKFDYSCVYNRWAGKQDSSEVVSVTPCGKAIVYDIVVGTDHTFIANGIVTHNTGRMSSGGSKGNPFFAPTNIQNFPKVEVFRYLHYAPKSSSISWILNDSPFKPLPSDLILMDENGTEVALKDLKIGQSVLTNRGHKQVVDCGVLETELLPYEGVYCDKNGEWEYMEPAESNCDKWFLDLGEEVYSVTATFGNIQIRTLQKVKTKGGMRDCFICPPGYVWISQDYSAEEQVLLANFSKEPNLINPIKEGKDIHKYVATQMFGGYDPTHRTIAKTIAFCANYGGSGYTIAKRLGKSQQEGEELLKRYNNTMSRATKWKQEMCKQGRRTGLVFTYFGRPRAVWMYYNSSDPGMHGFADRTCANSPIQGTGGDIIRIDHIKLYQKMSNLEFNPVEDENDGLGPRPAFRYACTIHDEINLFVKIRYLKQVSNMLYDIMYMKFPNWELPLTTSPSIGVDWGHQFDISGWTDEGVAIPACTEDLSLL